MILSILIILWVLALVSMLTVDRQNVDRQTYAGIVIGLGIAVVAELLIP